MALRLLSLITTSFSGLRGRLTLLVAAALLPVLALIFYNTTEQHRKQQAEIERDVLRIVQLTASQQRDLLIRTRQLLASTAQLLASMGRQHANDCRTMLAAIIEPLPYYINLGVSDARGNVYCSVANPGKAIRIDDRGYFREALARKDLAVGTYQIGRLTGRPTLAIGYPLHSRRQHVEGVIFAALDLQWVNELLKNSQLPEGATLTVIDNRGTILARQPEPEKWVGRTYSDAPLIQHILSHRGGGIVRLRGLDDIPRLYGHTTLIESGDGHVHLSLGVPESVAYAPVYRTLAINLMTLAAVMLFAVGLAWLSGERLALRPLRALTAAAGRVARGDLTTHLPPGEGTSELTELSRHFNDMTDSLRLREVALSETARQLQRSNRALATLSAGNQAMLAATDEQSLLNTVCQVAVDAGGYRCASVALADEKTPEILQWRASTGCSDLPVLPHEQPGADGPVVTRFVATDAAHCPVRLGVPFSSRHRMGMFFICSDDTEAFDADEITILQETVHDMVFGLDSLHSHQLAEESARHNHWLAYHDSLTGLENRQSFDMRLRKMLGSDKPLSLLLLDIDRFREISDTLGHEAGDTLLLAVTGAIQSLLPPGHTLARVGIDTFAVLWEQTDARATMELAKHLRQALLAHSFSVAGLNLDIHASIGIAINPLEPITAERLLRRAILALRDAKSSITGIAFFEGAKEPDHHRRLMLVTDLRRAIDSDELQLFCQPKLDLATRTTTGAEALLRWPHPVFGNVPPDEFIPLAEHTGLIRPLTEWVIEAGAGVVSEWKRAGIRLPITVNLSARNLFDPSLLQQIDGYLTLWKLDPLDLEFEITESALMQNPQAALVTLQQLHERGHHLYIDDFGTGYSSLTYLRRLPIQTIKIDKSFVGQMARDTGAAHIVGSTIALAHGLGLKVVAEGVEDEETLQRLTDLDCDAAQGYHIARPFPAADFPAWLAASPWQPHQH